MVEVNVFVPCAVAMKCDEYSDYAKDNFDPSIGKEIKRVSKEESVFRWPGWVSKNNVMFIRNTPSYEKWRELVLMGYPTPDIVDQIIAANEHEGRARNTIKIYVEHFRASIPRTLLITRRLQNHIELRKQADQTIDTLKEMTGLYQKMMTRIDLVMKKEQALGFLMNGVDKQFGVALDILTRIEEFKGGVRTTGQGDVILSAGDNQAPSARLIDWEQAYQKKGMNEVMSDPDSRFRVVKFVNSLGGLIKRMSDENREKLADALDRDNLRPKRSEDEPREDS